ncbi:M48 family metalloprotease [Streptomyces sp. NBC_00887]|uniref:M48 family metalloprotease n=1 Tax=Streptomyces sp. NBC_00887 TaxID=2975859 RepID=UPI003865C535|nr:M48 family metalloprotease [Streptomyces sp. NBC_00887]
MLPWDDRYVLGRGTTRRFALLAITLIGSSVSQIHNALLAIRSESTFLSCARATGADLTAPVSEQRLHLVASDDFQDCRLEAASSALLSALAVTGAVLCIALSTYWLLPLWRRRHLIPADQLSSHPQPLPASPSTGRVWTTREWQGKNARPNQPCRETLSQHLARLANQADLRKTPDFIIDPRALSSGAVVFGRGGKYAVCLNVGLVISRETRPEHFEAVVLHELAHIRNGDIDITYIIISLCRVMLAAVLVPCAIFNAWLLWKEEVLDAGGIYWAQAQPSLAATALSALLVVIVYLGRADILRRRELVADFDAVATGADLSLWRSMQITPGRGKQIDYRWGRWRTAGRWFADLWRTHPTWEQRYGRLSQPGPVDDLKGLQFLLLFGTMPLLTSEAWTVGPNWLHRVSFYALMLPLCASMWLAMTSDTPVNIPRGAVRKPPRPGFALALLIWYATMSVSQRLVLIAGVCAVLAILNPVAWVSDDSLTDLNNFLDRWDELPSQYREP